MCVIITWLLWAQCLYVHSSDFHYHLPQLILHSINTKYLLCAGTRPVSSHVWILFKKNYLFLELNYNWFTMFQVYSKVIQLHIHTHTFYKYVSHIFFIHSSVDGHLGCFCGLLGYCKQCCYKLWAECFSDQNLCLLQIHAQKWDSRITW